MGYCIYKGKGAMNIRPVVPTFTPGKNSRSIAREGALLLEFAPAGTKPKEYLWANKQLFSLDVNECAELLIMDKTKV